MKLGLLSQWFAPEPGGALVPTVLARELSTAGHDVRVLTGFPNYPTGSVYPGYRQSWRHDEQRGSVAVRRVPLYPSHDGHAVPRIANYLSFAGSAGTAARAWLGDRDALWVYNSPAPVGLVASRLRRRNGLPYLLHVMDVWPDSVLESGMLSGRLHRTADRSLTAVVERGYRDASLIAVTSRGQLDLLRTRGVRTDRLIHIPVCADESIFFPRSPDRALLPAEARDAELILMYAGALGHVQQLDAVVRAAASVRELGVHLVLVGRGVAEESLRHLVRELRAENVHFLGSRDPADMGPLTAAADVHVVSLSDSPLMRLTMPSKIQSIMAAGRGIVGACAGDSAHVIRDSGAGITVAPGDAQGLAEVLRSLAAAPKTATEMGANARRYYEDQLACSVVVNRVEEALRSVARG